MISNSSPSSPSGNQDSPDNGSSSISSGGATGSNGTSHYSSLSPSESSSDSGNNDGTVIENDIDRNSVARAHNQDGETAGGGPPKRSSKRKAMWLSLLRKRPRGSNEGEEMSVWLNAVRAVSDKTNRSPADAVRGFVESVSMRGVGGDIETSSNLNADSQHRDGADCMVDVDTSNMPPAMEGGSNDATGTVAEVKQTSCPSSSERSKRPKD